MVDRITSHRDGDVRRCCYLLQLDPLDEIRPDQIGSDPIGADHISPPWSRAPVCICDSRARARASRTPAQADVPRAEPLPAKALVIEDPRGALPAQMGSVPGVVVRTAVGQLQVDRTRPCWWFAPSPTHRSLSQWCAPSSSCAAGGRAAEAARGQRCGAPRRIPLRAAFSCARNCGLFFWVRPRRIPLRAASSCARNCGFFSWVWLHRFDQICARPNPRRRHPHGDGVRDGALAAAQDGRVHRPRPRAALSRAGQLTLTLTLTLTPTLI